MAGCSVQESVTVRLGSGDRDELNALLVPSAQYLGLPFSLGGKHTDYLNQMNVPDAHRNGIKGHGIRLAIVDSGLDAASPLRIADFYDIEAGPPIHIGAAGQIDNDGHGTAMAVLAAEVAPEAEIYIVRVMDRGALTLWNVLAGAGVCAQPARVMEVVHALLIVGPGHAVVDSLLDIA